MSISDRTCPNCGDIGATPKMNFCPNCGKDLVIKNMTCAVAKSVTPEVTPKGATSTELSLGKSPWRTQQEQV